jgi:hypothetical protein
MWRNWTKRTPAARTGRPLAGVLAVALALAACGGDGDDPTAANGDGAGGGTAPTGDAGAGAGSDSTGGDPAWTGEIDACALLEPADIEEALGTGPVSELGEDIYACEWQVGSPGDGPDSGTIGIDGIDRLPGGIEPSFDAMRFDNSVPVEGVGDDAFYSVNLGSGLITFRTGGVILWIDAAFEPMRPNSQEELTALAQVLVERL